MRVTSSSRASHSTSAGKGMYPGMSWETTVAPGATAAAAVPVPEVAGALVCSVPRISMETPVGAPMVVPMAGSGCSGGGTADIVNHACVRRARESEAVSWFGSVG